MPPRERMVDHITRWLHGGVVFSYSEILPERNNGMDDDRWRELKAESDDLFVSIIKGLDWERILMSALGRHEFMLLHDPEHRGVMDVIMDAEFGVVCGECIAEAALLTERNESWSKTPFNETDEEVDARVARMAARSEAAWEVRQ